VPPNLAISLDATLRSGLASAIRAYMQRNGHFVV
jgi:hypothetical protein